MTLAALALPAVVAALFVGVAWLTSIAVLPLWSLAAHQRPRLARTAWLAAAVPWVVAATVALGAVLPGDPHTGRVLACHCAESMPAWLHLCPVHPGEAAWLAGPALAVLALLVPGRLRAGIALAATPIGRGGGDRPRVVDLGTPTALLHGWLSPTLVVDRALWEALGEADREAVIAHERGHLARRDPQVLALLRALLVAAPRPLATRVARIWLDHAERRADAEAARALGDPAHVAAALVRCARLGATAPDLATAWTGGSLEARVQALVEATTDPPRARPDIAPLDLAVVGLLGLGGALATPWIHHQVEHLLNLSL